MKLQTDLQVITPTSSKKSKWVVHLVANSCRFLHCCGGAQSGILVIGPCRRSEPQNCFRLKTREMLLVAPTTEPSCLLKKTWYAAVGPRRANILPTFKGFAAIHWHLATTPSGVADALRCSAHVEETPLRNLILMARVRDIWRQITQISQPNTFQFDVAQTRSRRSGEPRIYPSKRVIVQCDPRSARTRPNWIFHHHLGCLPRIPIL